MFLIPTYVAPSTIHGAGVFAAQSIPAGTLIWTLDPLVDWRLTADELAAFPEPWQEQFRAYCFLDADGTYVFCGDNAKYMNHSDRPNCNDTGSICTVADRDIAAGEELTCDYRLFDHESQTVPGALYASSGDGAMPLIQR